MSWTEIAAVVGALIATAALFFVGMRRARKNYTHCPACGKTIFKGMRRCMHCEAVNDGADPPALVRRKDEENRPGE